MKTYQRLEAQEQTQEQTGMAWVSIELLFMKKIIY